MTGEEPDPPYHWEETMIHLVLEVTLPSMENTTTTSKMILSYCHQSKSNIFIFSDLTTPMNQERDPTVSSALSAAE